MPNITAITPTRAVGADAKGIFPPMMRAMTHIGFMLALVSAEIAPDEGTAARVATNAELTAEVDHIAVHWSLVIRAAYLSEEAREALRTVTDMVPVLKASVTADDRPRLFRNLQAVLKSILSAGVLVDQSAFGLQHPRDTDAGTAL